MNERISEEDFIILYKWFKYSQYLKTKLAAQPLKDLVSKEYFLINSTWVENFKDAFCYKNFKKLFSAIEKEEQLVDLYKNQIFNMNKPKNSLKIIDNTNIAQKDLKVKKQYIINSYYINFIIVDYKTFEILKKAYIMNESPKVNIYIGDSTFIIPLSGNDIEVGKFKGTYCYELLYIFRYENSQEYNDEVKKIVNSGLAKYLKEYKIKDREEDVIIKSNGSKFIFVNLKKLFYKDQIQAEDEQKNDEIEELDISKKKGLINLNKETSRLNSLIQIFTSIKEIKYHLFKKKDYYLKNNHIYILTSTLINVFKELYNLDNDDVDMDNKPSDLRVLKTIINFIDNYEENYKKSIDKFIYFILNTLNDELNESQKKTDNVISLISHESPYRSFEGSFAVFKDYYSEYYNSIISDCFNWIRKENKKCQKCQKSLFSFQAFPYLEFDLDKAHDFMISNQTEYKNISNQYRDNKNMLIEKKEEYKKKKGNQPIHIQNCFEYYSKISEIKNEQTNCSFCNVNAIYSSNYFVYRSPKYFIFIINKQTSKYLEYPEELNLETYIDQESEYKIYNLLGVLVNDHVIENEEKHYLAIIRDNLNNNWVKFNDDKVSDITTKEALDKEMSKKVRMLIYKGVK